MLAARYPLLATFPKLPIRVEGFEFAGEVGEGAFDAHAFEAAGSDETLGGRRGEDAAGVGRGINRAAVTEEEDVISHGGGGIDDVLRPPEE